MSVLAVTNSTCYVFKEPSKYRFNYSFGIIVVVVRQYFYLDSFKGGYNLLFDLHRLLKGFVVEAQLFAHSYLCALVGHLAVLVENVKEGYVIALNDTLLFLRL